MKMHLFRSKKPRENRLKTLCMILGLSLMCLFSPAQVFRNAYDHHEMGSGGEYGQGLSFNLNLDGILQTKQSGILKSYVRLYRATGDYKYLEKLVIHSKRLMDRRDDYLNSSTYVTSGSTCPNLSAVPPSYYAHPQATVTSRSWSSDKYVNSCGG